MENAPSSHKMGFLIGGILLGFMLGGAGGFVVGKTQGSQEQMLLDLNTEQPAAAGMVATTTATSTTVVQNSFN